MILLAGSGRVRKEISVMTAKEFLQQYGEAVRIAERIKTEYDQERDLIDSVRSALGGDGVPHGGGISKATENKAIKLADKALELKDAELEAIRIRQKVFDVIRTVPGEKGDVLYERYINLVEDKETGRLRLKTWDEVAEAVKYSKRHARNLHDEAIDIVQHFLLLHSIM